MRTWCVAVAMTCLSVALRAQSRSPEAFVLRNLALDVRIDFASDSMSASATLELENWTRAPSDRVSFLLGRLLAVSRVTDAGGVTLPFTQDVVRMSDDPMRQVNHVELRLPSAVGAGKSTVVRLAYSGFIVPYSEIGWSYVRDHIDTAFTIIREDALAFPSVGGLSESANRAAPRPEYTYDATVRAPTPYLVATGGAVTRRANDDGTTTWRYRSVKPSPFLNVAVAPFDTVSGHGVHVFYFREDSAGARRLLSSAERALDALAVAFGPLHDSLNLALIEIPDGWGSQASLVGGIIQTAAAFRDSTRVGELYHELSHLWNVKDLDAPSPRWNEGLAMFEQHLLRERLDGWTGRATTDAQTISRIKRRLSADPTLRTTTFADYGRARLTDNSYLVGDLMFATLYELVGGAELNRIMGGYFQSHENGGTTRDFVDWATRNSSGRLARLFDDWLFSTRWVQVIATASSVADLAARYR